MFKRLVLIETAANVCIFACLMTKGYGILKTVGNLCSAFSTIAQDCILGADYSNSEEESCLPLPVKAVNLSSVEHFIQH